MPELTVTSFRANKTPTISLERGNHVTHLHAREE